MATESELLRGTRSLVISGCAKHNLIHCTQCAHDEHVARLERELASLRHDIERAVQRNTELLSELALTTGTLESRERNIEAMSTAIEQARMVNGLLTQRAERAEAERDAALKDAERYRFLCEGDYQDDGEMWTAISNTSIKDEWDAEIDAAIAARKGEQ